MSYIFRDIYKKKRVNLYNIYIISVHFLFQEEKRFGAKTKGKCIERGGYSRTSPSDMHARPWPNSAQAGIPPYQRLLPFYLSNRYSHWELPGILTLLDSSARPNYGSFSAELISSRGRAPLARFVFTAGRPAMCQSVDEERTDNHYRGRGQQGLHTRDDIMMRSN